MRKLTFMWQLVKVLLFLLIQFLNVGIFWVGLSYLQPTLDNAYLQSKWNNLANPWFMNSLYIHGISACFCLLLVSFLVLFRIEKYVQLHRAIGKVTIALILLVAMPSGIVLSKFATGGFWGTILFFSLAIYTGYCAYSAYVVVRKKDYKRHEWYMKEVFLLLLSALFLRLLMTFFAKFFHWHGDQMYLTAATLSWIPSIAVINWLRLRKTY